MIFTYQTRIQVTKKQDAFLTACAELYGNVERSLFADIRAGGSYTRLKSPYLKRFGITARQYNAVSINLRGKIRSVTELQGLRISELKEKIARAEKVIKRLGKKDAGSNRLHQKKRRLHKLKSRLTALQADRKNGHARICFGGKKRFRAQFHLEENGFASIEAWRADWQQARRSEFFVIGSKDETAGCQGCVATIRKDATLDLRLRLPNAVGKFMPLKGVRFAYGQDIIEKAILTGTAISYRFKRDDKGWRIFVSTDYAEPKTVTSRAAGAIGVDINAGCLAVAEMDRFGNLIASRVIPCNTCGKTANQSKAVIGDAVKSIIEWAAESGKPVAMEKLDFSRRKAEIEGATPKKARMLSSFAYNQIQQMIRGAGYRSGVEILTVNPAYTSVIGAVNYSKRSGISIHQGAAFAVARRSLGFNERPSVPVGIVPTSKGDHVTFSLPVRNREKHVWSFWAAVRKNLKAAHAAHIRAGGNLAPAPLQPSTPALGEIRMVSAKLRQVSPQNCSAGDMDDVPF